MSGNLELRRVPTTLTDKSDSLSLIYANNVVYAEHLLSPRESGLLARRGRASLRLAAGQDPGH